MLDRSTPRRILFDIYEWDSVAGALAVGPDFKCCGGIIRLIRTLFAQGIDGINVSSLILNFRLIDCCRA